MSSRKQYDEEFKKQAVKLARKVGNKAAADELIPKDIRAVGYTERKQAK